MPYSEDAPRPLLPIPTEVASGEKGKAHDILAAIRILKQLDTEQRTPDLEEANALARFGGFGPVALRIFPDPGTGNYTDASWEEMGNELESRLTPAEYDSAKRTTFNAFYTSPTVIAAMHAALARLGVPENATILEPGCGVGRFMAAAPTAARFIGVELDSLSGRIARALHPNHDIRIENFRDTRLPEVDAVIGNVPFADVRLDYKGQKFALHDFFFAKSVDALTTHGALALVTSRYTLDKQNAEIREYLAERADFLGAIRLPSDAFKREGTVVVTDILFFRKRGRGEPARHVDPDWLRVGPMEIEGAERTINRYFRNHPEMVLGVFRRQDTLYGGETGYSVSSRGDLGMNLRQAIEHLPEFPKIRVRAVAEAKPFTPPPPLAHIGEGSFFIRDDRTIGQVVNGQTEVVVYGGRTLTANGAMTGKRLAALVALRDRARRVLQSQNEGWPDESRIDARAELNRAYDRFVADYGPINKTTFGETADGGAIRRMPNLVKFREDPDAMLVMSLEEYDEPTGTAQKAAILRKDVVGPTPVVETVTRAEDGLLVALDRRGGVDLPFISSLYGRPESAVVAELGDLIYRDPETGTWRTADEYLSGDVRAKLAAAERAGPAFAANADALRRVQPEDVLPGDIDANLGAPWIPASDLAAFTAALFGVRPSDVQVGHLKTDALWTLEAGYFAERSVAATSELGTARANGTWLLELALNMKTPVIYDPDPTDPDKRVVNPEATLAARDKQKQIRERFRAWIFADPDRTERLVRIYNDAYNNLRPRLFDGSHLAFAGMNQTIRLRSHQADAVWRCMSGGNTLLAHCVGAGKTYTMTAAGMKMKQAGLIRKPLFVVPNHMLEQFAREAAQLYPNAQLLVATKDDLGKDRRKMLTAKIASSAWDGIVVTHSSFERIGLSRSYQETFLRGQIAEYDRLLAERAATTSARGDRNLIKTIEKQKARREARLTELLAGDKKDDGLVFDELGVDHLFIDEAHVFKNLETATKMDRVAGVQTGGSERAFDLFMKARYLSERKPGRGVTFATGTPISNTMVETYTLNRFLDPEGMRARGIEHFDGWAAAFGEVVETMEIAPDGASLRPRSRFAKFTNLPELQQMFRQFTDVQTAEMLNLPRPRLEGDKPHVVACPMSDEQRVLQQELVARYDRLRSQKVDPRDDNALAITTDGRKLALDARMLAGTAPDFPGSKINALVARVAAVWERTKETRGTQMVFCDMGVHPTPWGYSAYDEIAKKLTAGGIPPEHIAAVGEADSDAKKQALFDRVRAGQVRILLGSTQKMGTGTNVQKRLVALHHLDAPWKPAEVEQREGRILRQGNENDEVAIYRYVTEGSFDAYMWQALETKARFIAQVMTGASGVRKAEDVGGQELSYAEVKAIASGNPAVLTLAEADAELQRLLILKKNHTDEQYLARRRARELPEIIEQLGARIANLEADLNTAAECDDGLVHLGERAFPVGPASEPLGARLNALPERVQEPRRVPLGTYCGLSFGVILHPQFPSEVFLEGNSTQKRTLSRDHQGPRAVLNALIGLADEYGPHIRAAQQERAIAEGQLRDYRSRLGAPFPHEEYLTRLTSLRDQLRSALSGTPSDSAPEPLPDAADVASRIKAFKAAHTIEGTPDRAERKRTLAEEPVTTRIRRRAAGPGSAAVAVPEEGHGDHSGDGHGHWNR